MRVLDISTSLRNPSIPHKKQPAKENKVTINLINIIIYQMIELNLFGKVYLITLRLQILVGINFSKFSE